MLRAAREEVKSNLLLLSDNTKAVEQELSGLEQQRQRLNPLVTLEDAAWQLVKAELPSTLIEDEDAFSKMLEAAHRTIEVNDVQRSRERFRVAFYPFLEEPVDQAKLERYNSLLGGYDGLLRLKYQRLHEVLMWLDYHFDGYLDAAGPLTIGGWVASWFSGWKAHGMPREAPERARAGACGAGTAAWSSNGRAPCSSAPRTRRAS